MSAFPKTRTRSHALVVQARVIKALMLRDIRTRFFGNGLGYVVAVFWPLTHMVILLTLYTVTGRVAPIGDDNIQFFAVGLSPAISFSYMSRWIMNSVTINKPLLNFPIVRLLDVIVARALLEAACSLCVVVLLWSILVAIDVPASPLDWVGATEALGSSLLLGLAFGVLSGVIVYKFSGWVIVYVLLRIIIYASSGVVFLPGNLPPQIVEYFAWNPLLHAIEWLRQSFYLGYVSPVLDKQYLFGSAFGMIAVSLGGERLLRQFLMRR